MQFKPHKLDLGSSTLSPATNKMVLAHTLDKMYKKKCQTWLRPKVDTAIYVLKLSREVLDNRDVAHLLRDYKLS